jgi:hypothetical protein
MERTTRIFGANKLAPFVGLAFFLKGFFKHLISGKRERGYANARVPCVDAERVYKPTYQIGARGTTESRHITGLVW